LSTTVLATVVIGCGQRTLEGLDMRKRSMSAMMLGASALIAWPVASAATADGSTFLGSLGTAQRLASTVPPNGDVNPYGVANVTESSGRLVAGNVLVTNFNAKSNVQGTGTTVVEVSPAGRTTLFANLAHLGAGLACPGGVGLTTALGILPGGWVVAGSLPTSDGGTLPNGDPVGCLIVMNSQGHAVETISNRYLAGPWDMAVQATKTSATLFVTNALGGNTSTSHGVPVAGNCTVVRLDLALSPSRPPTVSSTTIIGSGYPWRADKAALVLAPTGAALGDNGTLYVDDSLTNSVSAIPSAETRSGAVAFGTGTISLGGALDAPLGMVSAPNGDLVVVNGDNGNAVELTPSGHQVGVETLVRGGAGDLFGLAIASGGHGIVFVDDGTNTLERVGAAAAS
jgi:hypothetical protein